MTDFIIVAVLLVIMATAIRYLYKAKKNGAVCVGSPSGGCSGCCSQGQSDFAGCDCGGSCSCSTNTKQ